MAKQYVFISFRDPVKNLNLGVCIVEAGPMEAALLKTKLLNINPGGEAACFALDEESFKEQGLELDCLYTREEMARLEFEKINDP